MFELRNGMAEIKDNYKNKYNDNKCETLCGEIEDMNHLLNCKQLNIEEKDIKHTFEDILNGNLRKKIEVMTICTWSVRIMC